MESIKHYNLIERIGSGGMGEVYKAQDTLLERFVAIKVLHDHLSKDKQNINQLIREAKSAAKLVHPNVVTIHEIGRESIGQYIVMEYVEGISLADFIYNNDLIDPEQSAKLTIQILKAIQLAHQNKILHRDIKAENILITNDNQIKVLDFGIAKVLKQDTMAVTGEVIGTIDYMAPEQMLGEAIDQRCDLYSTGIVLYQLLTKELPFRGDSPVQVLFNKLNEEPIAPSSYNRAISKELDEIVMRSIHHEQGERWQNSEEFLEALANYLTNFNNEKNSKKTGEINYDLDIEEEMKDRAALKQVFVGRQKEFRKLVQIFNQTKLGKGQSVLISGEAGVGKSSLIKQFQSYAEYNNAWVIYGACLYQEGMDAYLPFIDGIRDFFSRENKSLKDPERSSIKNTIRKQIPELYTFTDRFTTTFMPKLETANESDPLQGKNLFESFIQLFSILAENRPVIVIIDDLQWADVASLKLFHYLATKIAKNPIQLTGISRSDRFDLQDGGKPTFWVDILSRMRREYLIEQIELFKFSKENTEQLIDKALINTALSEEFYQGLYEATRGNPFFILESLKSLQANNGIVLEDERWTETTIDFKFDVPDRVEDIFIRRLSKLNDQERELLQIASVIGYKFDPTLLSNIAEIKRIEVLKILKRLAENFEILHGTDTHYQFEHPMLGDLLYAELPGILAKEYHLMIAEQLEKIFGEDLGSHVGDVAKHYRVGGNHPRAVPLLYKSGVRSFEISAYREASLYFEDLLDSVDQTGQAIPDSIDQIDLYFKMGICYEEIGNWNDSIKYYEILSKFAFADKEYSRYVNSLMRIGRIYDKLGNWQKAMSNYEKCLELSDTYHVENIKSRVFNNIGINYFHKGDFDNALDYFQETITCEESGHCDLDRAHAYTNIGIIANILHGPNSVALENFKKALKIYEGFNSERNIAQVYQNMGMVYADKEEWIKAIEAFEKCLKIADETQEKLLHALTFLNLGKTYARQGTLIKAKALTEKSLKMFKRMNDTLGIAEAYHVFGIIYNAENDFAKAEKFLKESIKINKEKDYREGLAETYETYAQIAFENENMDLAQETFMKACNIYQSMNIDIKVKKIQHFMEEIRLKSKSQQMLQTKILTKKYGQQVRHS